jgi:hypothetical protein
MLIAALALAALIAPAPAAADAKRPDLKVARAPVPDPPGTFAAGDMIMRYAVANRGDRRARKRSDVGFFLSTDRKRSADDVRLKTYVRHHMVRRLRPGTRRRGRTDATVPRRVKPGIYRLIACADVGNRVKESREGNNCTTQRNSIAIQGPTPQGLGSGPPTASQTPPQKEYRPGNGYPNTDTGWEYQDIGKCPASTHGQGWPATNGFPGIGTSNCEWVTTPRFTGGAFTDFVTAPDTAPDRAVFGLFYCPYDHPFPFLVAIGTDPLWNDLSRDQATGTKTVKHDKYLYQESYGTKWAYSYAGLGPPARNPGYVFFAFGQGVPNHPNISGRAEYLCSDTASDLASV